MKAAYTEHYEEGLVAPESLMILNNSINWALDRTNTYLIDWKFLKGLVQYGLIFRLGISLQRTCCIGPLVHRMVYKEVRLIYDVFQNYIVCSNHALELLDQLKDLQPEGTQIVIDEARRNLD